MSRNEMITKIRLRRPLCGRFAQFMRWDDGVVTVEWVALSSAVVIAAIIVGVILMNSLVAPAELIGAQLTIAEPAP